MISLFHILNLAVFFYKYFLSNNKLKILLQSIHISKLVNIIRIKFFLFIIELIIIYHGNNIIIKENLILNSNFMDLYCIIVYNNFNKYHIDEQNHKTNIFINKKSIVKIFK